MDQKTIKYGSGALFETLLEIMLRFHMCDEEGRLAAEFLCQDGLVYEPISKQCGLPFKIDCIGSGRTKLQVEG